MLVRGLNLGSLGGKFCELREDHDCDGVFVFCLFEEVRSFEEVEGEGNVSIKLGFCWRVKGYSGDYIQSVLNSKSIIAILTDQT